MIAVYSVCTVHTSRTSVVELSVLELAIPTAVLRHVILSQQCEHASFSTRMSCRTTTKNVQLDVNDGVEKNSGCHSAVDWQTLLNLCSCMLRSSSRHLHVTNAKKVIVDMRMNSCQPFGKLRACAQHFGLLGVYASYCIRQYRSTLHRQVPTATTVQPTAHSVCPFNAFYQLLASALCSRMCEKGSFVRLKREQALAAALFSIVACCADHINSLNCL